MASDSRPVHAPSPVRVQAGYTACGRNLRRHVRATDFAPHITCPTCARIIARDGQEPREVAQ